MNPITRGMTGAAVEDVQDRLVSLGFSIDPYEKEETRFGDSTAKAVADFRSSQNITPGIEVDTRTWTALVDECYQPGDRTLYLRLPNFHGRDVREVQEALNIMGFSCGSVDGYYGAYTESAVKQFQESVGVLADGMAFSDTFDAIDRLHHVWSGKPAEGPHPSGEIGFTRAAKILESIPLSISAEDPISRNVAGRIWNLACATSADSQLALAESADDRRREDRAMILLSTADQELHSTTHNVVLDTGDVSVLSRRIHTAYESSRKKPPLIRIEIARSASYDGSFTSRIAQSLAILLLDALCAAFAR